MKFRRLVTALITLLFIGLTPLAQAQTDTPPGQGLEISPPLIDLKTDPGKEHTVQIFVRNVTRNTLIIKGQMNDFLAADEEGNPKLLLEESEQSPYSIKEWVANLPSSTLAPGERKGLNVVVRVPGDASPGGHYGVIRFTGTPPEIEDTGVSLSASVGTLMLVNVSGDIKQEAKIAEIYTADKNKKKRKLFEYGPVTIGIRLENSGSVHLQPSGTVRVLNTLGKETASFEFNQDRNNVLPASIRKFEQTVQKKLLFGRYKVQADVVYGTESQILSVSHTFWVIPYKLIIIALVVLVLLYFLIRGYNRLILKRAHKKTNGPAKKKK